MRFSWKISLMLVIGMAMAFYFGMMSRLPASGEDEDEDVTQKSTTVQVGGLLFDVDEGVEFEEGGGGSFVYLGSNREYMQRKFKSIERRLKNLETRLENLETRLMESVLSREPVDEEEETSETSSTGVRVLSTS